MKPTTLRSIMTALRDPISGCPWDAKQDHQTLAEHLREEVAETLDALAAHEIGDPEKERHLCEELGDVWLQIVFHAQLRGAWDLHEVERMAVEKLIRRHPHVFAEVDVADAEEVLVNWAAIKREEKAALGQAPQKRHLDGIARSLSPLDEAFEIGHRCAKVGFEWPDLDGVLDKVREEIEELQAESDLDRVEEEFGDVLFSLVQWARKKGLDPDRAMRRQLNRFKERFKAVEDMALGQGGWETQSLESLDAAWQTAKRSEIK